MSTTTDNDMTFFNNIQRLCNEKGISVTALGQELGLSNATTAGWRKGSQPRGKTLKMLADYFEVTVDQLMEDSRVTITDNHGIIGSTTRPLLSSMALSVSCLSRPWSYLAFLSSLVLWIRQS